MKEGDVVLMKEHNSTTRLNWKKGVIKKLIIENDKNVRGASVRTTYGKSTKTVVLNTKYTITTTYSTRVINI